MADKKLKKIYRRAFLNKKQGVAAIESKVDFDNINSCAGSLKITDCNHTVNLEFSYWNVENKAEMKYKIDKLIDELQAFRAALFPVQQDNK